MVNIKNIAGALTIASGTLLAGCDGTNVYKRAEQYMQNKLQKELNEVTSNRSSSMYDFSNYAKTQSKLDSAAYRDVFENTHATKDSSKVAEFNKIARQNLAISYEDLKVKLANLATVKEYGKIQKEAHSYSKLGSFTYEYMQYKTDSIAYRKFFEKHNLLNKKTLKIFNRVTRQIKP